MTDAASTAAGTVAVGVVGSVLTVIGLDPGPLFWSLIGASLGMSFAAPATRLRAIVVFSSVSLACSLFGTWLAQRYMGGELLSRNAFACGLAVFFHPLMNTAITKLPAAIDGVMRRLGFGEQQP